MASTLRNCVLESPIKFNLKLEATYNIPYQEHSEENRSFKTGAKEIFQDTNIEDEIDNAFRTLLTEEEEYTGRGSGFSLLNIDGLLLGVYKYTPLGGSSYITLPADIRNRWAIVNPQNIDEKCFQWAILAKRVTGVHRDRIGANYARVDGLYDFSGITYPTPL